eukprot:569860-Rhodomonas_salina.1
MFLYPAPDVVRPTSCALDPRPRSDTAVTFCGRAWRMWSRMGRLCTRVWRFCTRVWRFCPRVWRGRECAVSGLECDAFARGVQSIKAHLGYTRTSTAKNGDGGGGGGAANGADGAGHA